MCSPLSYCPLCENTAAELERATAKREPDWQAVAMITEPISMFLRSALYKQTALADLKKTQRLTPALQNEIAANVAAFINLASVSSNEHFSTISWRRRRNNGMPQPPLGQPL
jgi:hypothetical protein